MEPQEGRSGSQSRDTGSARRRAINDAAGSKATSAAPVHKLEYDCPVCGGVGKGDATHKVGRDGRARWFIGCWTCPSDGYLRLLAEATGAPGGGALLDEPLRYLRHIGRGSAVLKREATVLPSHADRKSVV